MGCGKSYTGRQLAGATDMPYTDLDFYIEKKEDRSITSIFQNDGESVFRDLESAYLKEVLQLEELILAAGGGTPCFNNNMELITTLTTSIYLKASPELLLERLQALGTERPLLAEMNEEELKSFIDKTLEQRMPYYEQANLIINADGDTVTPILELIRKK